MTQELRVAQQRPESRLSWSVLVTYTVVGLGIWAAFVFVTAKAWCLATGCG